MPNPRHVRAGAARPPRRRRVVVVVALLAMVAAGGALLLALAFRDPMPRFAARRSQLATVTEHPAEVLDGHLVQAVRLRATSGLEVELLLKRPLERDAPANAAARRPLVVILGGHKTGRDAAHLIPHTRGAIVAALSYPYRGEHRVKGLQVLRHVPAIRDAVLDTPPAVQLALDYLHRRPDVDPARTEGVGVSLGAPFMVIAGALDPRLSRVWSIHGSAGAYGPLEANLRRNIPVAPARAAVAALASALISGPRLAPERWVARVAPRPFVMVNALDDSQMPRALVERLYASAREPKSMIWVPGGHVRSRPEVIRPLVDTVLGRVFPTSAADSAAGGGAQIGATAAVSANVGVERSSAASSSVISARMSPKSGVVR